MKSAHLHESNLHAEVSSDIQQLQRKAHSATSVCVICPVVKLATKEAAGAEQTLRKVNPLSLKYVQNDKNK